MGVHNFAILNLWCVPLFFGVSTSLNGYFIQNRPKTKSCRACQQLQRLSKTILQSEALLGCKTQNTFLDAALFWPITQQPGNIQDSFESRTIWMGSGKHSGRVLRRARGEGDCLTPWSHSSFGTEQYICMSLGVKSVHPISQMKRNTCTIEIKNEKDGLLAFSAARLRHRQHEPTKLDGDSRHRCGLRPA